MDKKIYLAVFHYVSNHQPLRKIAQAIGIFSFFLYVISYAGMLIFLFTQHNPALVSCIVVPACLALVTNGIRALVKRSRPYITYRLDVPYARKTSYSFPSNHTASSFIIAYAFMYVNWPVGLAFLAVSILTAFSRLVAGFHYPSDLLAAILLSSLAALFFPLAAM